MCVVNYTVTWMQPAHIASAIKLNKNSGFLHQNEGWLKRLHAMPAVFSMAVFSESGNFLGYSVYQKNSSGIEILWMVVEERFKNLGVGSAMIDRMKIWLECIPERRGIIGAHVHQYADDLLYFLKDRGFECIKIDPIRQTYRMVFIGPRKDG